eukprot:jgi/Botrbrau1/14163/Bobra.182_3s0103.1
MEPPAPTGSHFSPKFATIGTIPSQKARNLCQNDDTYSTLLESPMAHLYGWILHNTGERQRPACDLELPACELRELRKVFARSRLVSQSLSCPACFTRRGGPTAAYSVPFVFDLRENWPYLYFTASNRLEPKTLEKAHTVKDVDLF